MTTIVCQMYDCIYYKQAKSYGYCACTNIGVESFTCEHGSLEYAICDSYLKRPDVLSTKGASDGKSRQ